MYPVATQGVSASVSASSTGAVQVPPTRRAAVISCAKRRRKSGCRASSFCTTFTATVRPRSRPGQIHPAHAALAEPAEQPEVADPAWVVGAEPFHVVPTSPPSCDCPEDRTPVPSPVRDCTPGALRGEARLRSVIRRRDLHGELCRWKTAHFGHDWRRGPGVIPRLSPSRPGRTPQAPSRGARTVTSTPSRTNAVPDPAAGPAVRAADRAHVFHSWSAQGLIDPLAVAGAEGSYFWDYDGNRYLDFSSSSSTPTSATSTPRSSPRSRSRPARMCTFAPGLRRRRPVGGRTAHRRAHPRRPRQDLLHQRRRRGRRERRPHGPAAHRPPQGAVAPTARTTAPPPRRSTSPATRAAGPPTPARPASCTSGARSSTARTSTPRPRSRSARARSPHLEETIAFEGPATIAAIILETVPGTAGSHAAARLSRGRPRDLRPLRHRLHPRRGHGGLRADRRVVRRRPLRRRRPT